MKYIRQLVIALGCFAASALHAVDQGDNSRHNEEEDQRDFSILQDFIDTKRLQDIREKHDYLVISGDFRSEWRHLTEKFHGDQRRGGCAKNLDTGLPIGRNDFDIQFSIYFDYEFENTWAEANLVYDNSAGVDINPCRCSCFDGLDCDAKEKNKLRRLHGSGADDDIQLKRCYVGWTPYSKCGHLDVEIGRRRLYDAFESEIQFLSRFDGILLTYSNAWEDIADWYVKFGGFLIDEKVNHFGWATEFALFNILDKRVDFKYSLINWNKRGRDRCEQENPSGCKFLNSQVVMTYHLDPELMNRPAEIYGAVLVNHWADQVFFHKKGWAWYAGMTIGEVVKAGDWSIEFQYEWLQQNAVMYDDQGGIGIGNTDDDSCTRFYPTTGYKGFRIETLYAITDNLSIDALVEITRSNQDVQHTFSNFRIETIYAF